jgi:UDP-glucose 4-epimerase
MRVLITGSAGHLGEALVRTLMQAGHEAIGLDVLPSTFTSRVGSIADRAVVAEAMRDVEVVLHAATLHKPHVATHPRQAFIDVNVTGTLNLLEEAVAARVRAFIFTSTTSTFGDALIPPPDAPAAWITEDITPVPKNIYGASKCAAEDLCQLFARNQKLPCVVLRTSRFFPEGDDVDEMRDGWNDINLKANEFLYRRVDIEDVVSAHFVAIERAANIGFGKFIISATTPFTREDLVDLRRDAVAVLRRRVPEFASVYATRGFRMLPKLDRVYVNERARRVLGWQPKHDFASVLVNLAAGTDWRSPTARAIGAKGYHRTS